MKSKLKKAICLLMSAAMLVSMAACGKEDTAEKDKTETSAADTAVSQVSYEKAAEKVTKSETVFVNMDAQGKITNKVVTDWLHTDTPETYIDDISDLGDIQNVKNDIQPVKNKDGTLRWNMQTTDLYYRGTTERELPVNFKITYYLNGKETAAKDIAGKSGQIKMVITMNNESSKEVEIGGKKATVYTPFICAGGMILDESVFSNVTVENGRTIGDGTKEIALLVGVPGLKESLNLSDEILEKLGDFDFTSTYTITFETEKFELSNMIFAVLPLSSIISEINSNLPSTVTDVKAQLGDIQGIIDKINGMNFTDLVDKLFNNTDSLTELTSSISKVTQVYNDNKALIDVLEKYLTKENIDAITKFVEDTENVDYDQLIQIISSPILQRFIKDLPQISKDMQEVMPIINGLSKDLEAPEVKKALDNLPSTLETLKELKKTVDDNKELIDTLGGMFDEETMKSLQNLMDTVEGVIDPEVLAGYTGLIDNADDLIARAEAWIKAGQEYNLFTTASKGFTTTVMFVYETSPITAPAEVKKETKTETAEESKGIGAWFKKLFKIDN